MSRIGKQPIHLTPKVKVEIREDVVTTTGPNGTLQLTLNPAVAATVEGNSIVVTRDNDSKASRALHGLTRSLLNNMVKGVDVGFTKMLEIQGVGYRAAVQGKQLLLNVGFSHQVVFDVPVEVDVKMVDNNKISITGADKQIVGQVAATIRGVRPPEPYKGKGIRYVNERVSLKQGKTA